MNDREVKNNKGLIIDFQKYCIYTILRKRVRRKRV